MLKRGQIVKKQICICAILGTFLFSACKAPEYSSTEPVETINNNNTEVLTFNGNVVEVTENNVIRVRVPRKGDYIEDGLQLNTEGIIDVSLASIKTPLKDMPFADVVNDFTTELLQNQEIKIEVPKDELLSESSLITGYVYTEENDQRVQNLLLESGMAIIDVKSPYYELYENELERFEDVARNNKLGIWALENFVTLSNEFDETFSAAGAKIEQQVKLIEENLQDKGWSIKEQLDKISK